MMSITSRFAVGFAQYVTLEQGVNGSVSFACEIGQRNGERRFLPQRF
jgi:hypothetical protein